MILASDWANFYGRAKFCRKTVQSYETHHARPQCQVAAVRKGGGRLAAGRSPDSRIDTSSLLQSLDERDCQARPYMKTRRTID